MLEKIYFFHFFLLIFFILKFEYNYHEEINRTNSLKKKYNILFLKNILNIAVISMAQTAFLKQIELWFLVMRFYMTTILKTITD